MAGQVRVAAAGMPTFEGAGLPAEPLWLPARPDRDDLEQIVAMIAGLDGELVIVLPVWADEAALRRVRTGAGVVERPVSVHVTELPPLAATVLCALAAALAPLAPSGPLLAGALPNLEREVGAFALLRRIVKLRHPVPSLAQRMRSLLPGAWFVASMCPEPKVQGGREHPGLVAADRALALGQRPRGAWLAAEFPRALDAGEPAPEATSWWGSPPALEGVTWPQDLAALAARVLPTTAAPCPWCGSLSATLPCPGCGHDRNQHLKRVTA